MAFSSEAFAAQLQTHHFGRARRYLEETDSTIRAAWAWLAGGGPDGGVVIAGRQTAGQGRRGRVWASPAGGLWLSVLARPALDAVHVGRLGLGTALATAQGVEVAAGVSPGLKWPNDVVLEGRKLAGVLVETRVEDGHVGAAVLSVGINVAVRPSDLPEEVRPTAISLWEAAGEEGGLEAVAARVLEALERLWPSVLGDGEELAAGWNERDVLRGRYVHLLAGGAHLDGVCRGVDVEGGLRLTVSGEETRVAAGELDHVRPIV